MTASLMTFESEWEAQRAANEEAFVLNETRVAKSRAVVSRTSEKVWYVSEAREKTYEELEREARDAYSVIDWYEHHY